MEDFKPSSWSQEPQDLAKEYNAWDKENTAAPEVQTEPEAVSTSMVRRGMLDPNTGALTGNSKQGKILADNARGFSKQGKVNYEKIFGHS